MICFTAKGHPNISALHKNTLEFTRESHVSPEGDCIVGVDCDFKLAELKKMLGYEMIRITMSIDGIKQSFCADVNKAYCDEDEMVFRITDYISARTLGTRSELSASGLDRSIAARMKDPDARMRVKIEGLP